MILWSEPTVIGQEREERTGVLKQAYSEAWEAGRVAGLAEAKKKAEVELRLGALVSDYEGPTVVFSSLKSDVIALGRNFRWMYITGENRARDLEEVVRAFNDGELAGVALTFAAGSTGIRFKGAKTLVMIGTAPPDVMTQAQHRAPGATLVLL